MEENIPRTEITAGSFIVENVDGGSTSGSESDPKGKRFLPWISSDGNDGTTQDNVTGDKGITVGREVSTFGGVVTALIYTYQCTLY